MKKTKGFTLIELLTVIAILAVVLLLAVPSILKVLENSKKEAAKDSALVYIREVNRKNQENLTYGNPIITGEELDILEEEYLQNLGISGTLPTQGIITITKLGKVESANLCVNGYNVEYDKDETKVTTKCGEIKNPYQTTDTTPGDLACKTIEGIRNCYIESIEDLVVFSDIVNGTNGKTQDSFENTIIKLETSLDIKKIESYATTNKWTYDINENSVLEDLKTELTTGKGFKPIGNNTNKFKGTLEGNANTIANLYINRSGESYVGLFGYNSGIIKGLNIELIDITAHEYLGGIAGYNIGTISEISITGSIKIDGISNYNSYTGGIAGYNHRLETTNAATIKNVIVNMNISGGLYTGGIVGQSTGYSVSYPAIVEGIVEGGSVTGNTNYTSLPYGYTPNTTANVYVSTTAVGKSNALAHIFNGTNDINGYEGVIDTWIGGDNDSSGYYFDYTKDKTDIIVKSIKNDKMTFNLDGSGTEEDPYLITNEKTWKIATLNVKEIDTYYKLMSDLDFSSSKFYMMGGKNNYFQGKLDGNNYTIKNITINGYEYLGITGYNAGEIKGLHVSNINITGQTRIGSLAGYNIGTLSSSNISTTIVGHEYLGGVVGYNTGTVNEVNVTGSIGIDVEATNYNSYIGGIAGYNQCLKTTDIAIIKNAIVNMNISGGTHTGGIVGYSTGYSGSYPAIVEGIVEGGSVTGNASYTSLPYGRIINTTNNIYIGTDVIGTNNSTSHAIAGNDINGYDTVVDTFINGDNDSSGYYFDYNQSNTDIVVTSANQTSKLDGNGTIENPYLIKTLNDWRIASSYSKDTGKYFKLMSDLDFNGENFYTMGSNDNHFKSDFDGNNHTIKNITISGSNYTSIFGYNEGNIHGLNIENIVMTGNSYVGVISTTNKGNIYGLNIKNADITAHEYLGGIAGYNIGTISEISITGSIKIDGISNYNSYTGGIAGYNHRLEITDAATIKNVIVNMNISGGLYTGGIVGYSTGYSSTNPAIVEGIVEGGSVTGNASYTSLPYGYTPNTTTNVYVSTTAVGTSNSLAHIFNGTNDINGYEGVIDTWIGGDNDSSGYYFDYTNDKTDIIVIPATQTMNLTGSGTKENPYLINNVNDWKIATLNAKEIDTYYKLMSDLDFSSSKFYMMGGKNNYFQGKLDGNNHTIKNITINGYEYLGVTGYNAGEIKGLHVSNINITGQTRIGSLAGYNIGTLSSSNISTTIVGHEYLGGVVGYNTGTVNEVNVTGSIGIDVEATNYYSYIGGIAGYNQCLKTTDIAIIKNAIVNMNISGGVHTGGIVGYSTGYSGSYPAIVEGIVEGGSVTGNASYAYAPYGRIINTTVKIYVNNSISTISAYGTTYFEPTNVNDLTYYGNILNTALTGDNDSSGYYFNYNQDNTDIVVVPSN